jgi:hypothetical protein
MKKQSSRGLRAALGIAVNLSLVVAVGLVFYETFGSIAA